MNLTPVEISRMRVSGRPQACHAMPTEEARSTEISRMRVSGRPQADPDYGRSKAVRLATVRSEKLERILVTPGSVAR